MVSGKVLLVLSHCGNYQRNKSHSGEGIMGEDRASAEGGWGKKKKKKKGLKRGDGSAVQVSENNPNIGSANNISLTL